MKLWTSQLDSSKFNSTETFTVGENGSATTHYLFSKAYVYKDYITNLEGNGTENDPYLIQSDEDWVSFGAHGANKYKFNGEYVKLTKNINVNQRIFIDADHGFRGTLDGDGNTVTANIVNENASENRFGIFGVTGRGSVVKNLTIAGNITSASEYTGGLAGLLYGDAYNCHNTAAVSGKHRVGGLVGKAYSTTIDSCTNSGVISASGQYVGGIAAVITKETSYSAFVISNCINKEEAVLTSSYTGSARIGGIVGWAELGGVISNCVNNANITLESCERIGGIAGSVKVSTNGTVKIENCINNGNLSASKNVAGMVAAIDGNQTSGAIIIIDGCSNYGDILASNSDGYNGGISGYSQGAYGKIINNFVSNTIQISKNNKSGYLCGHIPSKATITGNKLGSVDLDSSNNAPA